MATHITVIGKVQGVGFRYFTQKTALKLQLNGWVKNLSDGNVEILVDGATQQIDEFTNYIKSGPPHSKVEKITLTIAKLDESYLTIPFSII